MPLPLETPGKAEDRVLRQLVSSLIFEGIVEGQHLPSGYFQWSLGGRQFRCKASSGPFGRIRIAADSVEMAVSNNNWEPATLAAIIPSLPGTGIQHGKLLSELQQTATLSDWNHNYISKPDRRSMSLIELEGALDEGHPYHPCYKARSGFSISDHRAFGPECAQPFRLVWLAIARKHLKQNIPGNEKTFWQQELGEACFGEANDRLQELGSDTVYRLVPLHPWQWHNIAETSLKAWLANGDAHYLGVFGDRYVASQSLRSLFNIDRREAVSIKLPLNVVSTSARRILEPHSVCTAPAISAWINGVVQDDPVFRETYPLEILQEYAGTIADRDGPLAGQIGAIWRENADAKLKPGEAIIPFNALMMIEADGRPFADDWIMRYGLMPWMNRLLEIAILPVWHLLVWHGIAVEAHGQNMLLVHRDGWPVKIILRDFHESIEFCPAFLNAPEKAPDFLALNPVYRDAKPDQYYWTDNLDSLRELVMDTLFIYNLSEVSHLLEVCYGLPEFRFWQRVETLLASYAQTHDMQHRQAMLGHDRPFVLTESLMTRKLLALKPEYHHEVPNALAATISERRRKP